MDNDNMNQINEKTEAETNTPQKEQPEKPAKPKRAKLKHGAAAVIMTIIFVAIAVGLNIAASIMTERFPSMNIDLTAEGLNTLSEQALEIARGIDEKTEIFIMAAEEDSRADRVYSSYGVKYSQVANLADKLKEANSNIEVSYMPPDENPGFINEYADDDLAVGKVLVRTDRRYKVLAISDLYNITQNQETGAYAYYSKVDGALAEALYTVNLDEIPVFAIATGHNELLQGSMEGFKANLAEMSFAVEEFNILTGEIPDAAVLMLPTPSTDYTPEEIDKLREYVSGGEESRTILLTCFPAQGELPNLAAFMEEWSVGRLEGFVSETDANNVVVSDMSFILADKTAEFLPDKTYQYLVSPYSTPLEVLFTSNDGVSVSEMWVSKDSAVISTDANNPDGSVVEGTQGVQTLATMSVKGSGHVAVFGSSFAFVDSYGANSTFGNESFFRDMLTSVTGIAASGITIPQVQTNIVDISAPAGTVMWLGLGVFTIGLPLLILAAGIVIFMKRRHL